MPAGGFGVEAFGPGFLVVEVDGLLDGVDATGWDKYFKDFNSGAMIQNIVDQAKKMANKAYLDENQKGWNEHGGRPPSSVSRLTGGRSAFQEPA